MSLRRSLFLLKPQPQRRQFCNNAKQTEQPSFDMMAFAAVLGGAVAGGALGGVTTYNSLYHKHDYYDCVMQTTCGSCMGMVSGMATIILLPVIVPVATFIAVARFCQLPK